MARTAKIKYADPMDIPDSGLSIIFLILNS